MSKMSEIHTEPASLAGGSAGRIEGLMRQSNLNWSASVPILPAREP